MNLSELENALSRGDSPEIEIHAIEHMYITYLRAGEELIPLVNHKQQTLKYKSRYQALSALAETGLDAVDFVHRSAYGEMIGSAEAGETELRQTIDLNRVRRG